MTFLSRLLLFFPALMVGIVGLLFILMCAANSGLEALLYLLLFVLTLYGLPLLIYRLHNRFYPIAEGVSYLQGKAYSPWWSSHQIQLIYIAFPGLETLLRLVPGVFSVWLRLWGAKIGRQVYWSPGLELADRGLLIVGDRAIIGHRVGLYAHVIKPKRNNLLLYVKPIQIGSDAFIGSASRIGPGVVIAPGDYVPVTSDFFPNQKGTAEPANSFSETSQCAD
ncbi:MAG: acyl transferase [Phormidesmis sp.]